MNETIIKNWNSKIGKYDFVYHIGDFALSDTLYFLDKLNGLIYLIIGNHDKDMLRYKKRFAGVWNLREIKIEDIPITLCHYAMRVWNKSHFNSWHLYGHSHGGLEPQGKSWDIGVDNNNFMPLSFEEIKIIMSKRPDNFNFIKGRKLW